MLKPLKIKSIRPIGIKTVYDIEVENDHSYIANGFVNHNSGPMQQIPRVLTNPDIRRLYYAPKGKFFLEMDYSQAELRIVAELAKEQVMIKWFNQGYSMHVATAALMNKVEYEDIYPITKDETHPDYKKWNKQKKKAKTVNFGILYGQTKYKLSEGLTAATGVKVSEDEAQEFLDNWLKTFPTVAKWIKLQHKKVHKFGYVENIFGRKRRLPQIYANEFWKVAEAERQSVNSQTQGGSADFTTYSCNTIREYELRGLLPLDFNQLILTVHDSQGYYVSPQNIHPAYPILLKIGMGIDLMKYFKFEMKLVKMKNSVDAGKNWGGLHEYKEGVDYVKFLKELESK